MADSILTKQIGPFSGGVWLLVIGGGVGFAILLKKGFGGGSQQAMPIIVESVPLKKDSSTGAGSVPEPIIKPPMPLPVKPPLPSPVKPPVVLPPGKPPAPATGIKPVITLFTVLPKEITKGQSIAVAWAVSGATKRTLKRQAGTFDVPPSGTVTGTGQVVGKFDYVLTATNAAGTISKTVTLTVKEAGTTTGGTTGGGKDVPGGFPDSCQGVLSPPGDHPADGDAAVVYWMDHYMLGKDRGRGRALAWAIEGIGTAKLQAYAVYVSNPLSWALINTRRRTRGLRPLTRTQFTALAGTLTAQAKSGRDSFPDAFVLGLWNTYHMPYLCRHNPRNTQSRLT